MRILKIAMLVALAAVLGGTAAQAAGPDYVVLTPNLEMWYRPYGAAKDVDLRLRTLNYGHFNGWVVQTREVRQGTEVLSRQVMLFSRNDEGDVFYHGAPNELFTQPVTWVDSPLQVGKTWTAVREVADKGGTLGQVHYVFAVLEQQAVACPMGTYDCHRVFVATVYPDGTSEGCNFWYNPTCGLIQCCLDGEVFFELQKAQVLDLPEPPDLERDNPAVGADVTGVRGVPNPFNPMTEIRFDLARQLPVTVEVYDVAGRLVRQLLRAETLAPGPQAVAWDGRDDAGREAASGRYLARIRAGTGLTSAGLVLVR